MALTLLSGPGRHAITYRWDSRDVHLAPRHRRAGRPRFDGVLFAALRHRYRRDHPRGSAGTTRLDRPIPGHRWIGWRRGAHLLDGCQDRREEPRPFHVAPP